jgi:anti-sigma factor RsiW
VAGKDDGIRFLSHPSEDAWEEYAFGRLPEDQVARLEAHLLACTTCQSTLQRVDNIIHSMRSVSLSGVEVPPASPSVERWIPFPMRPAILSMALGALVLLVGLGVILSRRQQSQLPVALVTLASFRGNATASAPTSRPLDLEISEPDIPAAARYSLEVVTLAGDSAWKGAPELSGGKLVGHVQKGFDKGPYWVRLFGADGTLIREFGLQVQ